MTTPHTPGPRSKRWRRCEYPGCIVGLDGADHRNRTPNGEWLCSTHETYRSPARDAQANARLIAAAPALVAALEEFVAMVNAWDHDDADETMADRIINSGLDVRARAALRAARTQEG